MSETAPLDRRLAAFRPDLADARLEGRVVAERFVTGTARAVAAPRAPLRREPSPLAPLDSELLAGEPVLEFDRDQEGWAFVQSEADGYVGYVPADALVARAAEPTHRVIAPETLVFPAPDIKAPLAGDLPMGARITVVAEVEAGGRTFLRLPDATFVVASHLVPLAAGADDWVRFAEALVGTPYLWGGRTRRGIDCSGLVQAGLTAAGRAAPRDSDMQEKALGSPLEITDGLPRLMRGDLLFWPGHVGVMVDPSRLLHANAHYMMTVIEPLAAVTERHRGRGLALRTVRRTAGAL